jgi:hypothetical protein
VTLIAVALMVALCGAGVFIFLLGLYAMPGPKLILYIGDTLAILITTLIGFVTHGETSLSFLPRFAALYFPLSISWFLLAPWFGLFKPEITSSPKQLWRPVLVMLFAGPLAAVARGLILNAAILPMFVFVLGATSALGMVSWRGLYFLFKRKS